MNSRGYCPTCGKPLRSNEDVTPPARPGNVIHRCPERSLRAIDAAHRRDSDDIQPRGRTVGERINDGFDMMGD